MKKIYEGLIIQMMTYEEMDIITTSPVKGDNTLEDGFFD